MGAPMPQMPPPPPPQPVDPEQLLKAQQAVVTPTWDDIIALYRNDRLRSYRIDIETDSTIAADEVAEKQAVNDFIEAVGGLIQKLMPMIQQAPEMAPFAMELLKYTARRYKAGRQMEVVIDDMADKLLQRAATPPAQPQDPKVVAAQMLANAKIAQGQAEIEVARMKTGAEVQLKQQEAAANFGLRQAQAQADHQLEVGKALTDAQIAATKAAATHVRPY